MEENLKTLEMWRINRNMNDKVFDLNVEVSNLLEECAEFLRAKNDYERIDALCDICVFSINGKHSNGGSYRFNPDHFDDPNDFKFWILIDNVGYLAMAGDLEDGEILDINEADRQLSLILFEASHGIKSLGYNYDKCMAETIKEISSRLQDPEQIEDWATNGVSGKWLKDKNQSESTLYKADYEICKL